jgi:hypothetical protein
MRLQDVGISGQETRAQRERQAAGAEARLDGRTLAAAAEPAAYVVRCACDPSPDGTGGDTVVDHIRLFPLREDVRWTYRVHEQILPALRRANLPVKWTDPTVRHTGYVDKALRARKIERDLRSLRGLLLPRPSSSREHDEYWPGSAISVVLAVRRSRDACCRSG